MPENKTDRGLEELVEAASASQTAENASDGAEDANIPAVAENTAVGTGNAEPEKKEPVIDGITTKAKATDTLATNGIDRSKPAKGAWKNAKAMDTIEEESEEQEEESAPKKKSAKDIGGVTEANLNMTEEEFFKDYADKPKSESKKAKEKNAAKEKSEEQKTSENKSEEQKDSENKSEGKKDTDKKSGSVKRGDLLKKKLVDQYKAEKGEDKKEEDQPKEKSGGKLEKVAKFGGMLTKAAEGYDNSKSIEDNVKSLKDKVLGGDKKEDKPAEEKKETEKKDTEDKGTPTTEKDKAADEAVKEIVKKDDKEEGSEEKLEKVAKKVAEKDETAPAKKEEAEAKKTETKQEKADRLVGEAAAAIHDRAAEIAKENNISLDKDKDAAKTEEKTTETGKEETAEEKSKSDEEKKDGGEEKKDGEEEKKEEKKEDPLPIKEMATDLAAGFNNTVGAVSSLYAAKKSKSRRTKERQRIRGAQHILGALGNASGLVGSLFSSGKLDPKKKDGDKKDNKDKKEESPLSVFKIAGGALGAVSGGLQAVSAVLGIIGDKRANKHAAKIADKADKMTKNKYANLEGTSEDVRKVKALKKKAMADDPERYERVLAKAKKLRDSAKANKLAMGIASKFNRNKSKTSVKGIGDIVGGVGKMWAGISSATGIAGSGFVKNILSPIIKKGTEFAKEKLDERDKKNEQKEKEKDEALRMETVKEYLEGKRAKIKAQAKTAAKSSDLSDSERSALAGELTDAEADKIALARLGVSVSDMSSDKPASDSEMADGFEKIIMKRANNIMRAYNKDEMLDSLMLSHDATVEDVAKALKGE